MKLHHTLAALALAAAFAAPAQADTFVVDFGNLYSAGEKGDSDNTTLTFALGAGAFITGFSWDVGVTAFDPSWLSELTLEFTSSSGEGVQISPADGIDASGTHSSAGSVDLVNSGLSFRLKSDGLLYLEFFDSYDDFVGAADGRWNHGRLSFDYVAVVPEPASYAMLGLGLLAIGAARTRRRRVAAVD